MERHAERGTAELAQNPAGKQLLRTGGVHVPDPELLDERLQVKSIPGVLEESLRGKLFAESAAPGLDAPCGAALLLPLAFEDHSVGDELEVRHHSIEALRILRRLASDDRAILGASENVENFPRHLLR